MHNKGITLIPIYQFPVLKLTNRKTCQEEIKIYRGNRSWRLFSPEKLLLNFIPDTRKSNLPVQYNPKTAYLHPYWSRYSWSLPKGFWVQNHCNKYDYNCICKGQVYNNYNIPGKLYQDVLKTVPWKWHFSFHHWQINS